MKHRSLTAGIRKSFLLFTAIAFTLVWSYGVAGAANLTCPAGMTSLDCDAIRNGWVDWVPYTGSGCSTSSSSSPTTLVGSDNETKVWNFFISKGLTAAQTAGVVGNLQQESGFNPEIVQNGGNSTTQPLVANVGWGLAQWTYPYQIVANDVKQYNISGQLYDLATQLNLVWAQMTNTSPTGVSDMAKGIPNDPSQAALYFDQKFEGGTDPGGIREKYAVEAMQKYGNGTTGTTGGGGTTGCTSSSGRSQSPQCQSAVGSAKIICEAYKYDPTSYQESAAGGHEPAAMWHANCPVIGPSCFTDCSGLVNLAVYDAFGVDLAANYGYNTASERSDPAHWQRVTLSQLQPGDLMQPAQYAGSHVAIVDHVVGNTIYTFEAFNPSVAQPDQVGPGQRIAAPGDLYLHWVGTGSS